jgi:hypothetical protein
MFLSLFLGCLFLLVILGLLSNLSRISGTFGLINVTRVFSILRSKIENTELLVKGYWLNMDNEYSRAGQESIPSFDGDADKYTMWWAKFKAFATLNGFLQAIKMEPNPDMPTNWMEKIDLNTKEGR